MAEKERYALSAEAMEEFQRSAGDLAEQGPALKEKLAAVPAEKDAIFSLATQHGALRLVGYLLQLPVGERRARLMLEGGLRVGEAEQAMEVAAAIEARPELRPLFAHVWPGAFVAPLLAHVSHHHADQHAAGTLGTYLAPLMRSGRLVLPLVRTTSEVDEVMARAEIFIWLVSPEFLSTQTCWMEMDRALARRRSGEPVRIVPVMLRAADLADTPLEDLHVLPGRGRPISVAGEQGWMEVIGGMRRVIQALRDPPVPKRGRRVVLVSAAEDISWCKQIEMRVHPLIRQGRVDLWHEGMALPGERATLTLRLQMAQADDIVVLLGPALMASDVLVEGIRGAMGKGQRVWGVELHPGGLYDELSIPAERSLLSHPLSTQPDLYWQRLIDGFRGLSLSI